MGCCHGVALWMEYYLTDDITVSAGLMGPIGEQVSQIFHNQRLVFFARFPVWWSSSVKDVHSTACGCWISWLPVPCLQGECEWSRHRKQGVYFLRSPWESSGDGRAAVSYSFTFEPTSGDIKMDFSVQAQWRGAMRMQDWLQVPFTSHHFCFFFFALAEATTSPGSSPKFSVLWLRRKKTVGCNQ